MWYENSTEYTAASCGCEVCGGREVRLGNQLSNLKAILSNPDAVHNVSVTAIRMPLAFSATKGLALAEKIPA